MPFTKLMCSTLVRWALVGLMLALCLTALPATADPLRGSAGGREQVAGGRGDGGGMARWAADLQRDLTQGMTRRMREARDGSPGALLGALGLAFVYGFAHTMGPGHGKTIVVSHFLGTEARWWRGLLMGGQVALAHVAAAVVLVWLADLTIRQVLGTPPAEMALVARVSYGLILLVGLGMLVQALRRLRAPAHLHHSGCGCAHHAENARRQGVLAVLAGMVPCTGAILIMLYALANDALAAGIALVLSISLGMAVAMAALGLASMAFRRVLLARLDSHSRWGVWVGRALDLIAATLIAGFGATLLVGTA